LNKSLLEREYYNQQHKNTEVITMKQIKEFMNEDGFELNGYISQLFEQASDKEDNKKR
jgi:hypothetical protein